MHKQKVLIAGGGVPGLSLALALSRLAVDIVLIEPKPPAPFNADDAATDGRTVAIMQGHVDWLHDLGVWARVAEFAAPLKIMRIVDLSIPGRAASPPLDFQAAEIGQDQFAWNVPLTALRTVLWEALPRSIRILPSVPDEAFDLKIAADGRHSPLREAAGIKAHFHDTGQAALAFVVELDQPHNNISTEHHLQNGPVTFVPLAHPRRCSIVFVDREDNQRARQDDVNGVEQAIEIISGFPVRVISDVSLIPLPMMTVDALHRGNIILTAEAAHVLHPMGAQGMNLSLGDMKALSQLIEKTLNNGLDVSNATYVAHPYATARRSDHLLRNAGIRASLGFLEKGTVTGPVRRRILAALDALPGLRKTLMRAGQ